MLEEHLLAYKFAQAVGALEGLIGQMSEFVRLQLTNGTLRVCHCYALITLQTQIMMIIKLTKVQALLAVQIVLFHNVFAPEDMRIEWHIALRAKV